MPDFHYLYTYEVLSEQARLEAEQTQQLRSNIFKISLGWTLFSLFILSCGWGMNLQKVFDIGFIATTVCVILSGVAFAVNAFIYRHLNKKIAFFEKRIYQEKQKLKSDIQKHKDTQVAKKLKERKHK